MTLEQLNALAAAIAAEQEKRTAADRAQTKALLAKVDLEALLRLPVRDAMVSLDGLDAAKRQIPGYAEAMACWGRGITMTETGMPSRDWRGFLSAVRRAHDASD